MDKFNTNLKENALIGLANGIDIATKVVAKTLGGAGTNVIIEQQFEPYKIITNDGATCIEAMQFEDPLEKMGLSFLKEVVSRSNNNSGDGSTTTTVLVDAILKEGIKTGVSGLEIKESLDETLPIILQRIDEQTKQITEDNVYDVAFIAGESVELAETLSEIYKKIGKDGIIHLENSGTYETSFNFIEGVRFGNTGYLSPFMVYEEDKRKKGEKESKAVYYNPTILVTKRKISHVNDINPLLETLSKQGKKDLIIFTQDMDSGVASMLVKAHQDKVINCLIIKAPIVWQDMVFADFAKVTGATIVEDATGITFKNLELKHLGTCVKIVVDKDETVITHNQDLTAHLQELKEIGDNDSLRRLSWLQTKTAILKLGANSETELSYKRLKAEDCIHSCKSALQYGVVRGGGVCLMNITIQLPDTLGGKVMRNALQAPFVQNITNMGIVYEEKIDIFDDSIVDSAHVVKQAVHNAIGIASTILTASSLIIIPPKSAETIAGEVLAQRGVRPF